MLEPTVEESAAVSMTGRGRVVSLNWPVIYTVIYRGANWEELKFVMYSAELPQLLQRVTDALQGDNVEVEGAIHAELWFNGKAFMIMSLPFEQAYAEVRQK